MPAPSNYDDSGNLLTDDKKLFIANLGYQTTNATLTRFFSTFGTVQHAKVIFDSKGESKGFGFVWMSTVDECFSVNSRANPVDPLDKGGFTIDNRHGVHCSFHNTRKTGTSMETQNLNEAKAMAKIAAAAAQAHKRKEGNLQTLQQYQQPPPTSYMRPPPTNFYPPSSSSPLAPPPSSYPPPPSKSTLIPPPSRQLPPQFRCNIDGELMENPVIASDGYSYERFNLERYMRSHSDSPKTGQALANKDFIPNIALKQTIDNFIKSIGAEITSDSSEAATAASIIERVIHHPPPPPAPIPPPPPTTNTGPTQGVNQDYLLSHAERTAKNKVEQVLGVGALDNVSIPAMSSISSIHHDPNEGYVCYVKNLPPDITSSALRDLFQCFGNVIHGFVAYEPDQTDKRNRVSTGYGYVSYKTKEEHAMARKLGECIAIGRKNIACSDKLFPTIEHHRAIYWGERAGGPVLGNTKPFVAAGVGEGVKVTSKEAAESDRPRKKSRWGRV